MQKNTGPSRGFVKLTSAESSGNAAIWVNASHVRCFTAGAVGTLLVASRRDEFYHVAESPDAVARLLAAERA